MPAKLEPIKLLPYWTKELKEEDKPFYTQCAKRILAFSIAWEGTITLTKQFRVIIAICNTDFKLLENFHTIAKLGHITPNKKINPTWKPQKIWIIDNFQEAFFFLCEVNDYMPCERKGKIADLVIEFLNDRIQEHKQALAEHRKPKPHTERHHEIYREVKKLNKKGIQ